LQKFLTRIENESDDTASTENDGGIPAGSGGSPGADAGGKGNSPGGESLRHLLKLKRDEIKGAGVLKID